MNLLFWRASVFDVTEYRKRQLKEEVDGIDASEFQSADPSQLVARLSADYKFQVPTLYEERASQSVSEVDVDVSRDPMRAFIWGATGGAHYVKGTEFAISVPFTGDPSLFDVRPATFNTNPPRAEVKASEIKFTFTRTDNNGAALKSDYLNAIANVKQYLSWLEQSVAQFNSSVGSHVEQLIAQRNQRLETAANMAASIGIPVKNPQKPTNTPAPRSPESLSKSIKSPKKWDVFICHASEDKQEIAAPLATKLKEKNVAVWYDDFSLRVGDSLRASIDNGLVNSRYGVVILSKNFFSKHWPVQELNGLANREGSGRKVILPVWHGVAVEYVREYSPMLADKVAVKSADGLDTVVQQIVDALEHD